MNKTNIVDLKKLKSGNINRRKLESLRMLMDWQLCELGYDPKQICIEFQKLEDMEKQ